ncbi:MAG: glycyl-radical enzyme activating protein [Clostridia bacterium]|nr:glycyl-radical enzyme activating protein [Clostridia bacterium]
MIGRIFSVEEFSVYDGPGIRTSVFLKGCPLRCSWCHNPEGQRCECEIVRSPNGCLACGSCERLAMRLDGRFVYTEESIKKCPMKLLRICGEDIDSEELAARLLKNEAVLKMNGGGVTFSGGEPLMQSEFLFDMLKRLLGKVHTAIQTSGFASEDVFMRATELSDYFLYDLKIINRDEHIRHTGVPNDMIIKNFESLARSGKDFTVRVPLIPTVTDTEENISSICALMNTCGVKYAELLPYNKMAGGKYKMVGREYLPTFDESIPCTVRTDIFEKYNIRVKVL